ncbi:MAG: gliding motility-associated C-terminal domain-containing protein [Chitinophagales bacterium]
MKKYLLFLILLFISSMFSTIWGQTYIISETTVTDNSGTLFDSGGSTDNYGNGEYYDFTICPTDFTECILIDFVSFDMKLGDVLQIIDGTNIVASLTKSANPKTFVVYNSCTIIRFISNDLSTAEGWELTWTTSTDCPPPAPNDCLRAIPVCDNGILNFNSFGPGNDDFASISNHKGCLTGSEHQSAWYKIRVGDHPTDGGMLEFVLTPEAGADEDYDFAIYGPNLNCNDLGDPVRCSYADDNCHFCPETGLGYGATDFSEGAACPTCDGFVAALSVLPGETYYLLIDNFNESFDGFELTWGPDVILDCSLLNCDLIAHAEAIGETIICSTGPNIQLQGLFENNDSIPSYEWQADPPEAVGFLNNPFSPNPIVVADSIRQDFNRFVVYTLTVRDGDCVARDNVTVQIFSVPEPPTTDTLLNYCVGDEINRLEISTLSAGEFSWYNANPALNPTLTPLHEGIYYQPLINGNIAGTHHYWATETNNICTGEPTAITLNIFPVPELANIPEQAICSNSFNLADLHLVDVNGLDLSEANRQYFISPDLAPSSATDSIVTKSGIYWIMVDYYGCIDAQSVTVKLGDLSIEVQTEDADCGETNGSATVFTSNGVPPYTYQWSPDPNQNDPTVNNLAAGIYNVTIGDATGCIIKKQFAIFAPPLPNAAVSSNLTVACLGDTVQLFGATFSAGLDISYLWTGPNGFSTTEQNPKVVISEVGQANTFSLIVTVDGCVSPPKSLELFALPTPIATIINDGPSCENAPITLSAEVNASGNGSNLEYYWNSPEGLVGINKTLIIDNPIDNTPYTLVVRGGTCWSDTVSTVITVQQLPNIEVSNSSPVCIGEDITLQANIEANGETIEYQWKGPNFTSQAQNPIVENAVEGGFYELIATVNGCSSAPIGTYIEYHSQPDLPSSLPSIFACAPPFDLTTLEIIDNNGNDLNLSYFNDNNGTVGELLQSPIVEGIDYYWVIGETSEGCKDSVRITTAIYPKPIAKFNVSKSLVCADETDFIVVTFNGTVQNSTTALFNWDFDGGIANPGTGRGPHQVRWNTSGNKTIRLQVIENGCPSIEFQQDITTSPALEPPIVNCIESGTNFVHFDWEDMANVNNFEIIYTVNNGAATTIIRSNSDLIVNNLSPDDDVHIEVRALGEVPCGDSEWAFADCKAINCPLVNLTINGLDAAYCRDASPVNLVGEPFGGTFSGVGVVGNQFFPNQVGATGNSTIFYTYTDTATDCEYSTSQNVEVYNLPNALFELSASEICAEGGSIVVTYTGNASTAANFEWDFDGGNAVPSNGIGPHVVDWNGNSGNFNISLNVSENGCNAMPYTQSVNIVEALSPPEVTCVEVSTNSVTFEWGTLGGLVNYQISYYVNNVLQDSFNSNDTQLFVSNLESNDEVVIEVIIVNNGVCGNSEMRTANCVAQECPIVELSFVDLQTEFCVGDASFNVAANPPNGLFYLDGAPITAIEPTNLTADEYLLEYVYETDNCSYAIDQTIVIHAIPTANFSLSATEVCLEEDNQVSTIYEGTAGANASFEWDFGSGFSPTFEGVGPHTIEWNDVGTQTVGLTVEENGCRSEMLQQTVEVIRPLQTPQIICAEVTLQSVRFEWNDIEESEGYEIQVFVNTVQTSIDTTFNLSFGVDNLNTLDEVEVFITALGGDPCGNSETAGQICVAKDCPDISPSIENLAVGYCQDAENVDLTATPTGGVFSGEGVVGNEFQPSSLSAGTYTILYDWTDENDCSYGTQETVEVFEPQAFDLSIPLVSCKGDAVLLTLSGALDNIAVLDWLYEQNSASLEDLGNFVYAITWQTSGNQLVELNIEDVNGCHTFVSGNVEVYDLEVFTLPDTRIEKGDSIELTSQIVSDVSTVFDYVWMSDGENFDCPNCASIVVSPDTLTVYELLVTDENGCAAQTSVQIEVEEEDTENPIEVEPPTSPKVIVPNAFSPNRDGFNDVFRIFGYQIKSVEWQIFNRWGKQVFAATDASMAWDGRFKGQDQPIGTYVYTAIVVFEDGTQELIQGNFTLIR